MIRLKHFDFAQMNLTHFLKDLVAHAKETIHLFSKFLADEAKARLFELRDKFDVSFVFVFESIVDSFSSLRNTKTI